MAWSKQAPKKEGAYWFFGDPFDDKITEKKLHFVKVVKISNGLMFVADGQFQWQLKGFWQKVDLPTPPIEE